MRNIESSARRAALAAIAAAILATTPVAAFAETAVRRDWVPETVGMGDMWTFKCPAGGTFDLLVQNRQDDYGVSYLDPAFTVKDATGANVSFVDDAVPCNFTPPCGACPQALDVSCGSGGTFSIQVYEYGHCGTSAGGGYDLSLEVSDSTGTPLPASKIKLGGGPKSKVPAWHSAASKPAVDDANLN